MESLAISQLPPISLSLPTIMPDIHMNFPDRVFLAVLFLCMIVTNRYLRHRRLTKFRGCQSSYRKAPVKDPFIGLDFIYDRFFRKSPDPSLARSCQTFRDLGSTYTVSRWTTQAIHTCDSRNVKYMLATGFEDFELPKVRVSVMTGLLGTGIFTLDGQSWSHARSVLRPTLTKQKMGSLPDILECHVQALLRRIPSDGNTLDLQPLFFAVTMDVATEFLMGHSTYMLDDSKTNNHEQQFVDDYMLCSEEAVKKMHLGPLSFLRFNKEADRAKDRVFKYVDDYIDESLRRDSSSATFMRELANAIESRKTLRDQVLHILLASRDTTASLLSNLFFVLAKKPEVYHRLRSEVLETVGDGLPTFDKLKDMEYLKWCINESLRLHPVIPNNAREASTDTTLPYGGGEHGNSPLLVRKGTVVLYNVYTMHRDKSVFGDNVEDFVPDRWRGLRPGWGYLPFNGGPRVCIGQQFALLETYYIVARLVQTFNSMDSGDQREWMELSALATTCKNGVRVTMHRT